DAKQLALVVGDPDPEAEPPEAAGAGAGGRGGARVPKPIVIDRYKYKQDGQGYLLSGRHSYVYLYDIGAKKLERLTTQKNYDESSPMWPPHGARIAFLSNHAKEPDRDPGSQLYVADAKPGSTEKQLSPLDMPVGRGRVEWSADGRRIAILIGDEKKYGAYGMERLAVVPSDGSAKPALGKAAAHLDA